MEVVSVEAAAAGALCDLDHRNEVAQMNKKQQAQVVADVCNMIVTEGTNDS